MELAVRASCGKLFHKDIEEGTKDEKKAFVRAKGWWIRGKSAEELGLGDDTSVGK